MQCRNPLFIRGNPLIVTVARVRDERIILQIFNNYYGHAKRTRPTILTVAIPYSSGQWFLHHPF